MPPSPARAAPLAAQPSPPGKSSLFSRFRSPFGTKARSFTEFYIQLDDPDPRRQYQPGDLVTGSVILKVLRPTRVTHVVLCLHGFAQVYKNPNSPGEGYRTVNTAIGKGPGRRAGGYFGNGFVSLFEHEIVLCGEGRLDPGKFQFNFEMSFPRKSLPSSIDFERGTVSYMLTSTITRPASISPTSTCDRKIYFLENIDVANVSDPKPRMVSLEPISRRPRGKSKSMRKQTALENASKAADPPEDARNSRASELGSNADESEVPESPAPSDVSFDSQFSGAESTGGSGRISIKTGWSSKKNASKTSLPKRPITTSLELEKGGFLRGDVIPVKVKVDHTKRVQSSHGIIMTFYRLARVDMNPDLPITAVGRTASKPDEYYPKSRTGLGGLSLSSAGSSHVFRKDLSQSFAPLIVDPRTMTAEVKASLRVPPEVFPTIASVPGAMISFKYCVEVVVDVQGKLVGLDRLFPATGMMSVPASYGNASHMGRTEDADGSMFSAWGPNFLDTEQLRREKNIVVCTFDVVIGTRDSERRNAKQRITIPLSTPTQPGPYSPSAIRDIHILTQDPNGQHLGPDHIDFPEYPASPDHIVSPYDWGCEHFNEYDFDGRGPYPSHPEYVQPEYPIPDIGAEESGLSEKERLRRAEARLLPSRPPDDGESSATAAAAHMPTAPPLPEEEEGDFQTPRPRHTPPPPHPSFETGAVSLPPPLAPTDDKQELQRQRLEMERSAPTEFPNCDGDAGESAEVAARRADQHAPTAPALDDYDGFNFLHVEAESSERPPKYER